MSKVCKHIFQWIWWPAYVWVKDLLQLWRCGARRLDRRKLRTFNLGGWSALGDWLAIPPFSGGQTTAFIRGYSTNLQIIDFVASALRDYRGGSREVYRARQIREIVKLLQTHAIALHAGVACSCCCSTQTSGLGCFRVTSGISGW